ncbi:MAG: hypothetical protein Q8N90_01970 [bacterium]|nr:hypothetical protein [bacterium]
MPTISLLSEKTTEKSGYSWKILIFGILGIICSFVIGFSAINIFLGQPVINFSASLILTLALLFFLINFALESLFSQSLRWPMMILQSLAIVAGVYLANSNGFIFWQLGWVIFFVLFFWFGRNLIQTAAESMMKLRWHSMTHKGLAQIATAFTLFLSISLGILLWQQPADKMFISESGLTSILNSGNFIGRLYIKNLDWKMKTDDFLRALTEKTISSTLETVLGKSLQSLPADYIAKQKEAIIEQSIPDLKKQISQWVGTPISDSDSIAHVAYEFISIKYRALPANVRQIIIAVLVVLFFFTLRFVVGLFSIIVRVLGYLFYEILLALGVVHIIYETRTKESLILP